MEDDDVDVRVLVVIVPRPRDLVAARDAHWYRVPVARAPRVLAFDQLAFYQTAAFGADRWLVRYRAQVVQVDVVVRRELLPDEPQHPRADARYYRFVLGPLIALPVPVPSRRFRRVTFIPTTLGRLLAARDLVDAWQSDADSAPPWDGVWGAGVQRRRR